MRKAVIAALVCLTAASAVFLTQQATAQSQGGQGQGQGQGKDKQRPPPPPPRRCPDLALSTYRYVGEIPGGAPLATNEVALQFSVQNAGTAAYSASSPEAQSLELDYASPAGPQMLATTALPQQPTDTAAGPVALAQAQFWRGYLRATMSPEARRRPWRLRIAYNGDRYAPANDCDITNNEVTIAGPSVAAPALATPPPSNPG